MTDQPHQPQQPQQPNQPPQGQPSGQPYQQPQQAQYAGPQPMSQQEEKTWATLAHVIPAIAMVVSAGTIGFIASVILYVVVKDRGPFVRSHAANALNVQLTALIGLIISGLLMIVLVGFITYPLIVVGAVVIHVIGAMKANNGEWFKPPFTIDFVK
jgi:uncharacterized Tic20 family protein